MPIKVVTPPNKEPKARGINNLDAGTLIFRPMATTAGNKTAVAEYEQNLVHLIKDVRKALKVPQLPVVIAETGNCNNKPLRAAQAAPAARGEFKGTVSFVKTAAFLRPAKESPNTGHGHHWFGNAESYFLIGHAMGEAMKKLLPPTPKPKSPRLRPPSRINRN